MISLICGNYTTKQMNKHKKIAFIFKERSLCFPQPSSCPIPKLHWSSKPCVLRAYLSGTGPPDWGVPCRSQTPRTLERNSALFIVFPFVGRLPAGVDLDCHISTPPTCLVVVPFSYFQLQKILSTSLQFVLINNRSVNSGNFDVPMGGGELRVLLLHNLGNSL